MSNSLARKQDWKKVALTNVLAYDYAVFITPLQEVFKYNSLDSIS
jgi:hypothetical protein